MIQEGIQSAEGTAGEALAGFNSRPFGAQVATEMGNEPLYVLRPLIDVKVCVCVSLKGICQVVAH